MASVKLVIKDEVNAKFEGMELLHRKTLMNKYKVRLPYAAHIPAVKLGRWDGCKYFFSLAGGTYINLLPEILEYLDERNIVVDLDDQRTYSKSFKFDPVKVTDYQHFKWPKGHKDAGKPIILRDDQAEVINVFFNNLQAIQEVATGAGKTLITAIMSHRCEKYGRTIVIVPNKSLVVQTEADYKLLNLDVGVYYGDRKEFNKTHTICTWQSLNNLLQDTRDGTATITMQDFIDDVCAVIVDEAHGAKAEVLEKMLSGSLSLMQIRWGLTGTVPKDKYDYYPLICCIGPVLNKVSAKTLQDKGVLAKCHVNIVQLVDLVQYKSYQQESKYLMTSEERLKYISKMIDDIRPSGNTLVLVDRIETGKKITELVPNSVFVSGATKVDKRKEEYDNISSSDDNVIVATYGVASVGINIPRIFNLVLLEPGKSFVRVIQSIGRGIRIAEDKNFVQIWDITSTSKYSKRHLTKRKQFYKEAEYPFDITEVDWSKE